MPARMQAGIPDGNGKSTANAVIRHRDAIELEHPKDPETLGVSVIVSSRKKMERIMSERDAIRYMKRPFSRHRFIESTMR